MVTQYPACASGSVKPYEEMFRRRGGRGGFRRRSTKTESAALISGGAKHNLTMLNVTSAALARRTIRVAPDNR
jgi:hypothetical protein